MKRFRIGDNFRQQTQSQRLIIGSFIVLIGLLSLLDNLGLFDTAPLLSFWPTVFIVLGVLRLSQARSASSTFFGLCMVLAGALLTADSLGLIHVSFERWWPAFVIAGGISYILKGASQANQSGSSTLSDCGTGSQPAQPSQPGQAAQPPSPGARMAGPASDSIDVFAMMSGSKIANPSQQFRGGTVTAIMGGVEIDLRGASFQGEVQLDVTSIMGSIELMVPNDWVVVVTGMPILGAIEDHSVPPMQPAKRLIISGVAIMGGVEIRN